MKKLIKAIFDTRVGSIKTDISLLALRVIAGSFMMFGHGWGKLSSYSERLDTFSDPLGVGSAASLTMAVFAEFFCSIALVLGFSTRLAAIPLLITMLVAGLIVHANDPWGKHELPFLYAIIFIVLIVAGPGKYSVDSVIDRKCVHEKLPNI